MTQWIFNFAHNPGEEFPKVTNSFIDDPISPIHLHESESQPVSNDFPTNLYSDDPNPEASTVRCVCQMTKDEGQKLDSVVNKMRSLVEFFSPKYSLDLYELYEGVSSQNLTHEEN